MRRMLLATMSLMLLYPASRIAQAPVYTPPTASVAVLAGIKFATATPVNEAYRGQFERCDRENIFNGVLMRKFRKCSTDPNRARALLRFPDQTIMFESKMGLDIDGSFKACHDPGAADQCPTTFLWSNLPAPQRFVDPDKFPYIVIPIAGIGHADTEFRDKTGVKIGDIGVVVFRDKVVPVLVADGGPHNKLGEGSSALFKAVGQDRCAEMGADGHCRRYRDFSIERGVLFFIFPNSKIDGLNPENGLEKIRTEAMARWDRLKQG